MERLKCGELVYTGVRRTPVCAVVDTVVAAELFATMLDANLLLDLVPEDESDTNTADGRPATKSWAHIRLARMLGGDGELIGLSETMELARLAMRRQTGSIRGALDQVRSRMPEPPDAVVVAGSGEFLARAIAAELDLPVVSMAECLGPRLSEAACAVAVALLAAEPGLQQVAVRWQM